jgi:hypothetical protein
MLTNLYFQKIAIERGTTTHNELIFHSISGKGSLHPTNERAQSILLPRKVQKSRSDRATRSGPVRQDSLSAFPQPRDI